MGIVLTIFTFMITSNFFIGFKKLYFLFIVTGLVLLLTTFLMPQKASAQAFVPVKDQELIDKFTNFNNALLDSLGGGTYIDPTTGSPVAIATQQCSTTTLPGTTTYDASGKATWYSGKETYFNLDINKNNIIDPNEVGVYKKDWVFVDRDASGTTDGVKEWLFESVTQGGDVYYSRSHPDRVGPEDPRDPTYYDNPANPYFFLPNPDEMTDNFGINNSTSLNCLLQELVEWEKLQINMQMHSMIKEYFTDAQTYMLSQQLLGTLAAATIEWSNKELQHTFYIDGVATTTKGAIYGDVDNVAMRMASSELSGGIDEITGGAVAKNDLGLALAKQNSIAKNVNDNLREKDSFSELKNLVGNVPSPVGNNPIDAYTYAARTSALTVTDLVQSSIAQRMTQAADKQKSQWETYGGYLSDLDCGADPFCRNPTIKTPGNILSKNLSDAIGVGTKALGTADELGETTGTSSQELTYKLQQIGLRDYQVQQLLSNQQTPQELFNEFEFVLTDYYGINEGTTHWSRNMLINTWDDIMWGSGAPSKAEALGDRLEKIKSGIDP